MNVPHEETAISEGLLETLVKGSGGLVALADAQGVITFLAGDVEGILGTDRSSFLGRSVFDFVEDTDVERAKTTWRQVLAGTTQLPPEEYWTELADRRWVCLRVLVTNHLDDPTAGAIVLNVLDVSDVKFADSARRAVLGGSSALVHATTEDELYKDVCTVVVGDSAYDLAWVGLTDRSRPLGVRMVASGGPVAYFDALEHLMGTRIYHGPISEALDTGKVQVVHDVAALPESVAWRHLALDYGYRSIIVMPLAHDGEEPAVLAIYSKRANVFSDEAVHVMTALADDLAFGVEGLRSRAERIHYQVRFEASLEATVRAIATAAELRDPYTAGHQRRVEELARAIATDLDLDPDQAMGIGIAASIHDIGKLVVPSEILSKPGRLTKAEFDLVKGHPQAGYDIVEGIEFPWPVPDMILNHHERLDGSGYPKGLSGDDISIGTRILSVADVVEAMQSHRPYRPGLGLGAALAEVESGSGTLFDSEVVRSCLHLFRDGSFTFSTKPPPAESPADLIRTT